MKTIFTKYIGPSNTRGSRVKAYDEDGNQATVSYNQAVDDEEAHIEAVRALCDKMNWHGPMVSGGTKQGFVFVFLEYRPGVPVETVIF
jgi:hypothetical protein